MSVIPSVNLDDNDLARQGRKENKEKLEKLTVESKKRYDNCCQYVLPIVLAVLGGRNNGNSISISRGRN